MMPRATKLNVRSLCFCCAHQIASQLLVVFRTELDFHFFAGFELPRMDRRPPENAAGEVREFVPVNCYMESEAASNRCVSLATASRRREVQLDVGFMLATPGTETCGV